MENMLKMTEIALVKKQFANGLNSYTQSNCQVTLTDNGYRIYRPPNLNPTDNGNTMWGGFVLRNAVELTKNHTYEIFFDVNGKSSNAAEYYWSNNCGWGGGSYGLGTSPTNTVVSNISANFQGHHLFYYRFTISDDVYKTCTRSYSSFIEGTSYNCYRDFKFGFNYTNTGDMGTDLYITNLRMYDITADASYDFKLNQTGMLQVENFIEGNDKMQFFENSGDIVAKDFIEW